MFAHLKYIPGSDRFNPVPVYSMREEKKTNEMLVLVVLRVGERSDARPFGLWTVVCTRDECRIFKKRRKSNRAEGNDGGGGNCRRGNQKSGFTCSEIFIIFPLFRYTVYAYNIILLYTSPQYLLA